MSRNGFFVLQIGVFVSEFDKACFVCVVIFSYNNYGFLLITFLVLILALIQISISFTFYELNLQNWQWFWNSIFISSSLSIYVFVYSIYFYFNYVIFNGVANGFFRYFVYMFFMSIVVFVVSGTIGFKASYSFVVKLFTSNHID